MHQSGGRRSPCGRNILATARKQTVADVELSFHFKVQTFLDLAEKVLDARITAAIDESELAIKY